MLDYFNIHIFIIQLQSLRMLEEENQLAANRLEEIVHHGQELLEKIQGALSDIAQAQLDMQHLNKTNQPPPSEHL